MVIAATALPVFSRQPAAPQASPTSTISGVQCVIGCENIKPKSKGTISVVPTGLQFATDKDTAAISTASIEDIFVGNQSRQDVSGVGGTIAKAAIPYGGGRIVSLFSHKVEVLSVEYVDSNGGFHGAIYVLPVGQATSFRDQLVAQGAKVSAHVDAAVAPEEKQ
ncbi:MAG TPA: hypothetical protein VJX29_08495 [Candidatus Acidoferrales bacterium]|nr:hypothetical protein [Candidatus Acidoferrales bacterium]